MEKFFVYICLLLPVIGLCATLLAVKITRNIAHRKAGKSRGIFE